jgi:hypothetical protein
MFLINDETTEDDVIEHILIRLNTDFVGGCLQVPDFCVKKPHSGTYDRTLEMLVREKMYDHDVATRCTGKGQPDTAIMLRPNGVKVHKNGGWKKYLIEFEKEKIEKEKLARQPHIKVDGNAIIGNNNSNNSLNHGLLRSDLPHSQPITKPNQKNDQPKQTEVNTSKAQLIFWLFSAFATGIAITIAVLNFIKHK